MGGSIAVWVLLSLAILPGTGLAQPWPCTPPTTSASVVVSDYGDGRDTLWFGYDPTATPGIDWHLCEGDMFPHPPAGVFYSWFFLHDSTGIEHSSHQDYRTYISPTDIDTHKIRFQPGNTGFPISLQWDTAAIRAICDSAILQDEFGGAIIKARMHTVSQAVVPSPVTALLLIRYGQRPPLDAEPAGSIPEEFRLEQNYPNPFFAKGGSASGGNPKTRIKFSLPSAELRPHPSTESATRAAVELYTTLIVYDLLGHEVATLVNEKKDAGIYEVGFSANDLPSGVYFYRLTSNGRSLVKMMTLAK